MTATAWTTLEFNWPDESYLLGLWITGAKVVVAEDFRLFPNRNLVGSDMSPARVLGFIEGLCKALRIELVLQPASNKEQAVLPKLPRGLGGHARDAIRHVFFYLNKMSYLEKDGAE